MAELGSDLSAHVAVRTHRKMRKTQSCSECRRRKIRCIFPPGNAACSPCSMRGSRCVDQRGRVFTVAADQGIALRDRVLDLDVIQELGAKGTPGKSDQEVQPYSAFDSRATESSDIGTTVSRAGHIAPIVSILGDPELPWTASSGAGAVTSQPLQCVERKANSVCETLRSALPSYDATMSILSKNGAWWNSFRLKSHAVHETPVEPLAAFGRRTYTTSNPAELGILVAAYARSMNQSHHLYDLVDRMVISDFSYSATLEGLECLILLAKSYTDIGQPRRAWFMWRRGIATAQLMGLYRAGADCAAQQRIWWAIYHGDRFTSLLLGLPYGFNDIYYTDTVDRMADKSGTPEHQLILRCAIIAGKIIDRNISPAQKSFAKTMDLDEQMDTIAADMPRSWWDIPNELLSPGPELDRITERLLQQFFFFHIKLYLHLPFIVKSATTDRYDISTLACMEAARQMLKIFQMLRAEVEGACLFDCKTSDFVSFTAAVVLLIGHSSSSTMANQADFNEDSHLIESAERIFHKEEREKQCKIASQCRNALRILSSAQKNDSADVGSVNKLHEIPIPYFGTVVRRSVNRASAQPLTSTAPSLYHDGLFSQSAQLTPTPTPITRCENVELDAHTIDYMGYDLENAVLGNMQWGMDYSSNLIADDLSSWLDDAMINLNQVN